MANLVRLGLDLEGSGSARARKNGLVPPLHLTLKWTKNHHDGVQVDDHLLLARLVLDPGILRWVVGNCAAVLGSDQGFRVHSSGWKDSRMFRIESDSDSFRLKFRKPEPFCSSYFELVPRNSKASLSKSSWRNVVALKDLYFFSGTKWQLSEKFGN